MGVLIVTADDYGYASAYDGGILELAQAGAVDAVSAMVSREAIDPAHLLASGVEVGLHLDLDRLVAGGDGGPEDHRELARAGEGERESAVRALEAQVERFEEIFGRSPAHLDGHHHCHARPGVAAALGRSAAERGLPVRSVDGRHRRLLRCQGVPTPDLLVGRVEEQEPALPAAIAAILAGAGRQATIEWMTHICLEM